MDGERARATPGAPASVLYTPCSEKKDPFYILSYLFQILSNFYGNWNICRSFNVLSYGIRIIHLCNKYSLWFMAY